MFPTEGPKGTYVEGRVKSRVYKVSANIAILKDPFFMA